MRTYTQIFNLINNKSKEIIFPNSPANLYDPIRYFLLDGGKRIRPVLTLLSHQIFSDDLEKSILPSLGIEFFHNFTLIHDDIMDKAPVRRGKKTIHRKWNKNIAILAGDSVLVHSYDLLRNVRKDCLNEVLSEFNKAAKKVCEGQQMDMDFECLKVVSENEYLKMIEYKTAVLIAISLKIGAINGGATKSEAENLYDFGINMGLSFQIKDDLLDIFGQSNKIGKQIGGDILSAKKTILYVRALEIADVKTRKKMIDIYHGSHGTKVEEIKDIYESLKIEYEVQNTMNYFHKKAMRSLDKIQTVKKNELVRFIEEINNRIV
ncbi:MAG: isoprenyl synthetase [Flavobacteriales bacterium]|nr:isoprenyl synthetase [Flavobacteriales bacterium]